MGIALVLAEFYWSSKRKFQAVLLEVIKQSLHLQNKTHQDSWNHKAHHCHHRQLDVFTSQPQDHHASHIDTLGPSVGHLTEVGGCFKQCGE